MAQNSRGFDPTQTAIDWLERGVYTVPLRPRSKRPKDDGWTHLRLVHDQIPKKFKPGDNIGALWGEPSKWAVDVDLDMDEACDVADYLLPETFTYGRRGKEYSHYVFKCRGAETKKWFIKELGMIVEIRSTGAQSVIAPSEHPDGGRYFIHDDIDFRAMKRLDLERLCDEIAVAAVMLHFYPEAGTRHDYVHVCTGVLCHAGWKEEKILRVLSAVLNVALEDDDDVKDRVGTVRNTVRKYNEGDNRIKGFTSLEDFMSIEVIASLRRWVQSGTYEAKLDSEPAVRIVSQKDELLFNPEWLEIPGVMGEVAKWANSRSYIDQPVYGLAAAVTCTALATCNNYYVSTWDTPLQPYTMITGVTGSGKDAALRNVMEFAVQLKLDEFVVRGIQSYYAMLDVLGEPPNMLCLTWDEAARNLASAKNINGPDFQTITHVLSLYGAANTVIPAVPGRKNPIPELHHPFFILLATAQPDMLLESLTSTAQETGVVNRMMLFDCGPTFPPLNADRATDDAFPSSVLKPCRIMKNRQVRTEIKFADERTYVRFQEFEEIARRRTSRKEYTWARANQNALILAGLAAVGQNPKKPVITGDIASWAMQIVNWSNLNWEQKLRVTGGETVNEKESFRVQKVIANPREFVHLAKDPKQHKQRKLLEKGLMPHSVLKRATRSIQPRRFQEIILELHDIELIGSKEVGDALCYFAKE